MGKGSTSRSRSHSTIERILNQFQYLGEGTSLQLGDLILKLVETLQISSDRKFTFLLVGRTGVGKSSTINSLMGKEVAKTGKYDPTTMSVEEYHDEINGVRFTVIDTPGLCDDLPEQGNDRKYIDLIRSKIEEIDCLWFVTRLDESRITADEIRGIKIVSEAFGSKIWKHSVIIFTRADKADDYLEDLQERKKRVRAVIANYTDPRVANSIPAVAVANGHETTPDGKNWLGTLWTKVFVRIGDRGAIPYFMATFDRVDSHSKPNWTWGNGSTHQNVHETYSTEQRGESTGEEKSRQEKIEFDDENYYEARDRLFSLVPVLQEIGDFLGSIIGGLFGGKPGRSVGGGIGRKVGGTIGKVLNFFFGI